MEFVLAGFRQVDNIRLYYFDAVEGKVRQQITVSADLTLIRNYRIALQELPLLCRRLLERRAAAEPAIVTESEMARHVSERAAANLISKRRQHRAPVSDRRGQAWRGHTPPKGAPLDPASTH